MESVLAKAVAAFIAASWGVALLGVGAWMQRHGAAVFGMIACLFYAGVFFWFAWSVIFDRSA